MHNIYLLQKQQTTAVYSSCPFYFDANSTFSAIHLLFHGFFNLAIKYGDVVNRSISFVATSSNPLKRQLQEKRLFVNQKIEIKENRSYLV